MKIKILKNKNGFSLMETLIALSIVALVSMALYTIQKDIITFNRFVQGGLTRENNTRKFLKEFSLVVRGASPSSNGGYLLEEASTTSMTIYNDTDSNGVKERIRYFLSGSTINRGTTIPTGAPLTYNLANEKVVPIVTDITSTSTIFYYYDSGYTGMGASSSPISQPVPVANVRMIKIEFAIDPNGGKSPVQSLFSVKATIRQLRNI